MTPAAKLALFDNALAAIAAPPAPPVRRGSSIDRRNWVAEDSWYRQGNRIAWYDRNIRLWTLYDCEPGTDYQCSETVYYVTVADLLAGETLAD